MGKADRKINKAGRKWARQVEKLNKADKKISKAELNDRA